MSGCTCAPLLPIAFDLVMLAILTACPALSSISLGTRSSSSRKPFWATTNSTLAMYGIRIQKFFYLCEKTISGKNSLIRSVHVSDAVEIPLVYPHQLFPCDALRPAQACYEPVEFIALRDVMHVVLRYEDADILLVLDPGPLAMQVIHPVPGLRSYLVYPVQRFHVLA